MSRKTVMFTLTPHQSKRLIGKAVAQHPAVQRAWRQGKLFIAGGTTNAYVLEELTGKPVEKGTYSAGVITANVACITDPGVRQTPAVFVRGEQVETPWQEAIKGFGQDDVILKGANAIDMQGNAGVLLAGDQGGTIGIAMGHIAANGITLIMPVGLEKLVPSVPQAAKMMGRTVIDDFYGMPCGLFVVNTAEIFTELNALEQMFSVDAAVAASGGISGTEGAVTFVVAGEQSACQDTMELVRQLLKEQPFPVPKRVCPCTNPCRRIR